MEFPIGDITKIVGRVSRGDGENKGPVPLTKEQQDQLDEAGNKFYKNLHGILHGLKPPAKPVPARPKDSEEKHIVRGYTTPEHAIVLDIYPYDTNPQNQTIAVIIRDRHDFSSDEIKIIRPKSRKKLIITINGRQAKLEDLEKAMEKMRPSLKPETKAVILTQAKTRAQRKTGAWAKAIVSK